MAKKRPDPTPKSSSKPAAAQKTGGNDRLAQLERLIELMVQKDVVEVELEEGTTRWRVRRTEPQTVTYAAAPAMAMPTMPAMPMQAHGHAAPAQAAGGAAAEPQGEVFKSPMLGTFYRAASPEAEPFCKVGDRVNGDKTLCIIEAMKVMNEIKAEREFEILEILVKNGEPVEFGQPLFLIR
ncbi:MAG: acetyl-CoA carboxylase biotin carboxyl carrier protein [Planctomycetes bacterium]|nr:acetyl-CoA carboxylase biotin carboxyl carrier protein [Planctomycetota bacterium]